MGTSYQAPENGFPFSGEGLLHMSQQCFEAAKREDSSLFEMAGLMMQRYGHEKLYREALDVYSRILGCLDKAEKHLEEGPITYAELKDASQKFQEFADRLKNTTLQATSS